MTNGDSVTVYRTNHPAERHTAYNMKRLNMHHHHVLGYQCQLYRYCSIKYFYTHSDSNVIIIIIMIIIIILPPHGNPLKHLTENYNLWLDCNQCIHCKAFYTGFILFFWYNTVHAYVAICADVRRNYYLCSYSYDICQKFCIK